MASRSRSRSRSRSSGSSTSSPSRPLYIPSSPDPPLLILRVREREGQWLERTDTTGDIFCDGKYSDRSAEVYVRETPSRSPASPEEDEPDVSHMRGRPALHAFKVTPGAPAEQDDPKLELHHLLSMEIEKLEALSKMSEDELAQRVAVPLLKKLVHMILIKKRVDRRRMDEIAALLQQEKNHTNLITEQERLLNLMNNGRPADLSYSMKTICDAMQPRCGTQETSKLKDTIKEISISREKLVHEVINLKVHVQSLKASLSCNEDAGIQGLLHERSQFINDNHRLRNLVHMFHKINPDLCPGCKAGPDTAPHCAACKHIASVCKDFATPHPFGYIPRV